MHYMDWYTFCSTMIAFALHWIDFYSATKVLYSINAVIFYVGIMQSYRAFENLGPKLVMIKGMVSLVINDIFPNILLFFGFPQPC